MRTARFWCAFTLIAKLPLRFASIAMLNEQKSVTVLRKSRLKYFRGLGFSLHIAHTAKSSSCHIVTLRGGEDVCLKGREWFEFSVREFEV